MTRPTRHVRERQPVQSEPDAADRRAQLLQARLTEAARAALTQGPVGAYLKGLMPRADLIRLGLIAKDEACQPYRDSHPASGRE